MDQLAVTAPSPCVIPSSPMRAGVRVWARVKARVRTRICTRRVTRTRVRGVAGVRACAGVGKRVQVFARACAWCGQWVCASWLPRFAQVGRVSARCAFAPFVSAFVALLCVECSTWNNSWLGSVQMYTLRACGSYWFKGYVQRKRALSRCGIASCDSMKSNSFFSRKKC